MRDKSTAGRGFWLHQIVEYLIAAALILMSAQSRHPFVLAAYGIALLINVTVVDGPFSAYKIISRGVHRIIDWLFVGAGWAIKDVIFKSASLIEFEFFYCH